VSRNEKIDLPTTPNPIIPIVLIACHPMFNDTINPDYTNKKTSRGVLVCHEEAG
jgi:hypothetical protein